MTGADFYRDAARLIVRAVAGVPRPVILVDGRSGAGKSTLATRLEAELPSSQLVRMDDIYPGWDGLDEASAHVVEHLLVSATPRWRRWDWAANVAGEWVSTDPDRPLIVEGTGSLSRASAPLATVGVWVDSAPEVRQERALRRDGESYRPYWDRWARQETHYVERERPDLLADFRIDTTTGVPTVTRGGRSRR